jgi:hypothetical protein
MDAQFWIYIIIGLIYFLSRLLKKPEQPPEEMQDNSPERRRAAQTGKTETERPKQLTFEELLREITEGKKPEKPVFQPAPQRKYESFDDDLKEEGQRLEDVSYNEVNDAEVFKAYEEAKNQVAQRSSFEESLRLKNTAIDFEKFKAFEQQKKRNLLDDYIKIIRNPEGLKQAIVMSEILKRKF